MLTKILTITVTVLVFLSCGKKDNEPKIPVLTSDFSIVQAKAKSYCEMSYPSYQELGYVHSKCDGSGFTSLHAVACQGVIDIDLSVFSDAEGKLYRDPKHECFEKGESASESSKDMTIMRMLAAYVQHDKKWVDDFTSFASKHDWVVCKGKDAVTTFSRCLLSPAIVDLLKAMKRKMEGIATELPVQSQRSFPDIIPLNTDYRAHLEMLRLWLSGQVYGGVTDYDLHIMRAQAKRQPENALFKAIASTFDNGYQASAIALLLNDKHFPDARLPDSKNDYCTGYLFQRDKDEKNWVPCPSEPVSVHSGTDYAFAAFMIQYSPL